MVLTRIFLCHFSKMFLNRPSIKLKVLPAFNLLHRSMAHTAPNKKVSILGGGSFGTVVARIVAMAIGDGVPGVSSELSMWVRRPEMARKTQR